MNAQEAARILAKENDSVVVVGITREASGDLTILSKKSPTSKVVR
jgi:hypothetical protein